MFREYSFLCLGPWRSWQLFLFQVSISFNRWQVGHLELLSLKCSLAKVGTQERKRENNYRTIVWSRVALITRLEKTAKPLRCQGWTQSWPAVHGSMSPFDFNRTSLKWVFEIQRKRGPCIEELMPRLLQPCSDSVGTQDILTLKTVWDCWRQYSGWVRVWLKNQTSCS